MTSHRSSHGSHGVNTVVCNLIYKFLIPADLKIVDETGFEWSGCLMVVSAPSLADAKKVAKNSLEAEGELSRWLDFAEVQSFNPFDTGVVAWVML